MLMGPFQRLTKAPLLLFIALLVVHTAAAEVSYVFEVADNGETTVRIEATAPTPVVLPPDATVPFVTDGFIQRVGNQTIIDTDTLAEVTYTSSYYTRKEAGVWYFEVLGLQADRVILVLPQEVHVIQSVPRAQLTKKDTWQLTWGAVNDTMTVSYVRIAEAQMAQQRLLSQVFTPTPFHFVLVLAILIAIAVAYTMLHKQPASKETQKTEREERLPHMTEGQLNIIRAANPNEALVLKILLKQNGHIKRNQLERESQLSKSSLASVLKVLERKNIITIDRTFFVHYITTTPWFRDLP